MSEQLSAHLHVGRLDLTVEEAALPLEALCCFATRNNPRRPFLFVSKVLGKHIPVKPSRMREMHLKLAARLRGLPEPVLVVGLAETATALGHGVFDSLDCDEAVYLHTTRYRLSLSVLAEFEEPHSHAVSHILYWPTDSHLTEKLKRIRSVVIVDDELTTGNTVANLLEQLTRQFPALECIRIVCLTNWMDKARQVAVCERFPAQDVAFESILKGNYVYTHLGEISDQPLPAPAIGNGRAKDAILPGNHGRLGLDRPLEYPFREWAKPESLAGKRVLVLGTGEFMYPPYLFALWLEGQGIDVRFHASTRSPALLGGGIQHIIETQDNYEDAIPNFVYNLDSDSFDNIFVGYETRETPGSHDLVHKLSAKRLDF